MNILAIDTSNELLGVALVIDGQLVAEKMTNIKKDHSSRLMPAIVDVMASVQVEPEQLNRLVVAHGPGSYTGVRIGVTTAKTMAWALNIPIYPVSSLRALAYNGVYFDGYIWPFFDARRNAMYTGLYKYEAGELYEVIAEQYVSLENWLKQLAEIDSKKIICLSPHINVFKEQIYSRLKDKVFFPPEYMNLIRPSNLFLASNDTDEEQVHLVKPNYLRITEAEANLLKG